MTSGYKGCIALAAAGAVFLSCLESGSGHGPRGAAGGPDTLAVLWYNVENLFDRVDDGTEYPPYSPVACGWNDSALARKLDNIATVIAACDADIAGLCEVENRNALGLLRSELEKKGCGYSYYCFADKPAGTATAAALLARFPLEHVRTIPVFLDTGDAARGILEADVRPGETVLKVFLNHWPSKYHPESHRLAAARALKQRLEELDPAVDFLVLGDLNEDCNECETFFSAGHDNTGGVTGLNHVLGTVQSAPYEPIDYIEKNEVRAVRSALFDPWLEPPSGAAYSYVYRGNRCTPDHILLPGALFDTAGYSYVDRSFRPVTLNGRLLREGVPYRWQLRYRGDESCHTARGYSDHLPLTARVCRAPYSSATEPEQERSAALPAAPPPSDRPGGSGFETGFEGWIPLENGVGLARDTASPARGRYCLRLRGTMKSANRSVARCVYVGAMLPREGATAVTLFLKGTGSLCFRLRPQGDGRWEYFNPPRFVRAGTASYSPCTYPVWTPVTLSPAGGIGAGDGLEIELRAKKRSELRVWIDDIVIASP